MMSSKSKKGTLDDDAADHLYDKKNHHHGATTDDDDDDDISSVSSTNTNTDIPDEEHPIRIADKEARWVWRSKILVFTVIICATILCAFAVYSFTSNEEEKNFEYQFENYAYEMLDNSRFTARNVFATIQSMSTTVTSHTLSTNATWPFVTVPHYVARGQNLLELSGSFYIALTPLVKEDERLEWEKYAIDNQGWLQENMDGSINTEVEQRPIMPFIWESGAEGAPTRVTGPADPMYGPFWQVAPPVSYIVNQDVFSIPGFHEMFDIMTKVDSTVISHISRLDHEVTNNTRDWPFSYISSPVHRTLEEGSDIVAVYSAVLPWNIYFKSAVPDGTGGIYVVIKNQYDEVITYIVDHAGATYLGPKDLHDKRFSAMELAIDFDVLDNLNGTGAWEYTIHAYPSEEFHESYKTAGPIYYTLLVVMVFLITSMTFVVYDCFVKKKDTKVMDSAENTNAIVTSLFPAKVRERLLEDANNRRGLMKNSAGDDSEHNEESQNAHLLKSKPIADLFPSATVMFADIVGFTAWASVREPSQVFTLLEQIYGRFDAIAKRRGVFKVETIGDCYVAAAGLPEVRKDHATLMVRFARDCLASVCKMVNELEVLLGPDTAELGMRFGLHSGPVTAGVLRGDKSRFQLFGDTVNTAERIEATGAKNRIQISQETADCLIQHGKGSWFKPRRDPVFAKGKGDIQTYWIDVSRAESVASRQSHGTLKGLSNTKRVRSESSKTGRLVEWNVSILSGLLKQIVAMRDIKKEQSKDSDGLKLAVHGNTVLEEVKEVIDLRNETARYKQDPEAILLDPEVVSQLRSYVEMIASLYRNNPFHNFEHASHVCQSVTKLLSRVVTPGSIDYKDMSFKQKGVKQLHEYTHGITSDPLIQFACAFSALIHDVDHSGVPNTFLIKENPQLAELYCNKSVAEQNSVDLAWDLLEGPRFKELRACIFSTEDELVRFRQLVVNSVMATDIADKELGALRKKRWNIAFSDSASQVSAESSKTDSNRKATIVIEHLIQASDVSHTMQHWHVYLKWNERLFREMYRAYQEGRMPDDPSKGWYQGEIGFFDFYLIPLGKKLKECEVFGVCSDEYLNYAQKNRAEWEKKGKEIVAGYLERLEVVVGVDDDFEA